MTSALTHTVADDAPEYGTPTAAPGARPSLRRRLLAASDTPSAVDLSICVAYLALGMFLTRELWTAPAKRALEANVNDQTLIEWFLAHGTLFWTGDFNLVTDRLNAPEGVNLMGNASHILHGILMAPVTAIFGVAVSFTVLVAVNLAATAAGWYLLLARTLKINRAAAVVGGAVAGFGPGMISQSNAHLHITAQWLVPPIIWCVIRMTRVTSMRSALTTAAGLALLVTAQVLLGEEVLFLAALTLVLFAITYAVRRPRWTSRIAPRFLASMAVATGLSAILLAYPLWVQFAGPLHIPNAPFSPAFFYADVASYVQFSPLSILGSEEAGRLSTGPTEFNTYLGWPLLLVFGLLALWRWRSPVTPAIVVSGLIMTLLSFGPHVTIDGDRTEIPGLYRVIRDLPVVSGALPSRYALALLPSWVCCSPWPSTTRWDRSGRAGGPDAGPYADGPGCASWCRSRCWPRSCRSPRSHSPGRTARRCPCSSAPATGATTCPTAAPWCRYPCPRPPSRTPCAGRRWPTTGSHCRRASSSGHTAAKGGRRWAPTPSRPRCCSPR